MATIEKRLVGGSDRWLVRYRDPNGKQKAKTFRSEDDAVVYMAEIITDIRRGDYRDPRAGNTTVGEWARKWLDAQGHLKASTRARYEGLLRVQILPRWGGVRLSNVDFLEVQGWVSDLGKTLSASSVRQAYRVFSLLMETAVRSDKIGKNPAAGVKLPKAASSEKRFLTLEQVEALADAAGEWRTVILTLSFCGLRWGELAALRVKRVDTMRRRITVAESVTEVAGVLEWGTPKSHQRRSVPIPRSLVDELEEWKAGKDPEDLVFTTRLGAVLRNMNFRRDVFDAAATAAGLEGLTPHELRHTAASLAVSQGANVKAVQRMLGHQSAAMTLDVYSGLFEDDLDGVADRMDEARVYKVGTDADVVKIRHTGA
ncbi:tyrosine-type recombinase/integrase [Segeticoccus rhizosphaerae]|uniref:tyrosine-type recombinase/integrase n=1 Tax=Segeticoccus rhizosphaerae TaxID=1104777 RepID=UPI0010C02BC8|nr:site-specific integrase [Ornithinicoccus soli]